MLVAESFYLTKNIEKYDSGIIRIRKELETYPEVSFKVEEVSGGVLVTFALHSRDAEGVNEGVILELEKRYVHEIEEIFGIIPSALTANEANYLIGFRSADEIRKRLTKARKETDLRLRSKGIERKG